MLQHQHQVDISSQSWRLRCVSFFTEGILWFNHLEKRYSYQICVICLIDVFSVRLTMYMFVRRFVMFTCRRLLVARMWNTVLWVQWPLFILISWNYLQNTYNIIIVGTLNLFSIFVYIICIFNKLIRTLALLLISDSVSNASTVRITLVMLVLIAYLIN